MKAAKCTSCGANITVDETKDAGICPFCNTPFTTEKAIKNLTNNSTTNNAQVVNYYYGGENKQNVVKVPKTERPKINFLLAFLGLYCGLIPGIIYIAIIKKKQKEWDDKYTY